MSDNTGYALELTPETLEDLSHLDKAQAKRIVNKLIWLAANADELPHEALQGNWAGYYLNDTDKILLVSVIGHRKDVYTE